MVPRPHQVVRNGKRQYPPHDPNWPAPPPGRPRFAHQRMTEEFHVESGVTYRTYADGLVIAYARVAPSADVTVVVESDPNATQHHDWAAMLWTHHPVLVPTRARLVRNLVNFATFRETVAIIDAWELEGEL